MVESNEKIKPVAKCMNTGNEVGSWACLYCVVRGCEGHKIARKRQEDSSLMSERVTIDTDKVRWAREIQKEQGGEMSKEKNPKQVLIDWVTSVQNDASMGNKFIHSNSWHSKEDKLNKATECFIRILGQCETMMTVLKNAD